MFLSHNNYCSMRQYRINNKLDILAMTIISVISNKSPHKMHGREIWNRTSVGAIIENLASQLHRRKVVYIYYEDLDEQFPTESTG